MDLTLKSTPILTIDRCSEAMLPTRFGVFRCIIYRDNYGMEHASLIKGEVSNKLGVLCRIQSECLTGEVFSSLKCDCKDQLDQALKMINSADLGILIYLRQEGRGIGLANKIKSYRLQELGADTVDANRMLGFPDDNRDFSCGVQILKDQKITSLKLITNNPLKVEALTKAGLKVVDRIPCITEVHEMSALYMRTKHMRMGHLFS